MKKMLLFEYGISCVCIAVIAYIFLSSQNRLEVLDQSFSDSFVVTSITLTSPGFLVIVKENELHKPSTDLVIKPEYFIAGTYKNIRIPKINADKSLKSAYFAFLFLDTDANKTLSQQDAPAKNMVGQSITVPFLVQ